jgi:hypothetical protein
VSRDHDAVYHTRWRIDLAYQRRLPNVGLVQFRPGSKLGSNDFLAGPEPFIVAFFSSSQETVRRQRFGYANGTNP